MGWTLDGEIGYDKCNHDICMCGQSYIDVNGFWRSVVPHSGQWHATQDTIDEALDAIDKGIPLPSVRNL